MNKSLYGGLALFVAAACFNACSPDDNAVGAGENGVSELTKAPAPTPANPAICFVESYISKNKPVKSLAVVDADGSHHAFIYEPGGTWPSWSPDGSQICFLTGSDPTINKITVGRDSKGMPIGTNLTVVYAPNATDGIHVFEPAWSPTGSEIAFSCVKDGVQRLMVISSNGGTPTEVYSQAGHTLRRPAWSPDGSKIAFVESDSATQEKSIQVVSRSTGALLNTYIAGTSIAYWAYGLDWSRTGLNKILFRSHDASGVNKIYTIDCSLSDPSPVAVPIPSSDVVMECSWSPDNSKIVYMEGSLGLRTITLSTGAVTTISSVGGEWVEWKR